METNKGSISTLKDAEQTLWYDYYNEPVPDYRVTLHIGLFAQPSGYDQAELSAALKRLYDKLLKDIHIKRGTKNSERHTPIKLISSLANDTERLAASVAAEYDIPTTQVTDQLAVKNGFPDADTMIADSCFALVALWDGIPNSDLRVENAVKRTLLGNSQPDSLEIFNTRTVYDLILPSPAQRDYYKPLSVRTLCPYPLESGVSWYYTTNPPTTDKSILKIYDYNEHRYRQNIANIVSINKSIMKKQSAALKHGPVYDLLPELHGSKDANLDNMRHLFTDAVSMVSKKRHYRRLFIATASALLSMIAYAVFSDYLSTIVGQVPTLLCAAVVLFMTIAAVIFIAVDKVGDYKDYIRFRLIAEAMRTRTYWQAAGIENAVFSNYSPRQKIALEGICYVESSWLLADRLANRSDAAPQKPLDINKIKNEWFGSTDELRDGHYTASIKGQLKFARKRSKEYSSKMHRENIIRPLITISAVICTIVLGLAVIIHNIPGLFPESVMNFIDTYAEVGTLAVSIVQILAAAAAAVYAINSSDLTSRYVWMGYEFQRAAMAFENADTIERKRELLVQVGAESNRENGDWAMRMLDEQPEMPI